MDSNRTTLLKNICRTCMNGIEENKGIESKAISIFSEAESMECKNITIMELLMVTTPQLSIDSDDMLPKTICESCMDTLLNTYKFQKMCIRVEQILREMIKNETPIESQMDKGPLNAIPRDNVSLMRTNVLTHFLKIEVEEPLIEQNETSFSNNSFIDDGEDIKSERGDDRGKDMSKSDEFNTHMDGCVILSNNVKSKKGCKMKKKNKDAAVTKDQQTSEISKECTKKSKSINNAIKSQNRLFKCGECGKAFRTMEHLKQHFLRHGTERSYECPDCPKRFYCLSNLFSHKAVHNKKEKSHVCNICGAAFVQASLLKKHEIYHKGEKKYKCDYCDMRFFFADTCRTHIRIHTGEKPYKCKYCEKAFSQSYKLTNHLRVHLGDNNVYQCELCPLRFPTAKSVREHFTTHKNDDEETKVRNISELNALEIKGRFVDDKLLI